MDFGVDVLSQQAQVGGILTARSMTHGARWMAFMSVWFAGHA
jgi:hypothetical protein